MDPIDDVDINYNVDIIEDAPIEMVDEYISQPHGIQIDTCRVNPIVQ